MRTSSDILGELAPSDTPFVVSGSRQSGTVDGMQVEPEVDPGILGVDHVGVAVADLDPAVAFHVATLGLVELHREQNTTMGVAEVMLGGRGGRPGDDPGSTQIQLLAPLSPDSPIARFLDRSGPGIQHLAYRVENVEHAARVLRKKGLRLLYDAAKPGTRGSRINFVHPKDAGGVLIELVESDAVETSTSLPGSVSDPTSRAGDPGGPPAHRPAASSTYDREQE
jgi:methylmalonyl-CoA/ethylmalonyl-CoA epimerase